jgi:hypothetical protein
MAKLVLPRVHVLVVCDEIEPSAGQEDVFDLRGVRTMIPADGFPHTHPQLCVFMQVTGHQGAARWRVKILDAGDDPVFASAEEPAAFHGPLNFIPLYHRIQNCEFPSAGIYYVPVFFDGKLLGERALILFSNGEAVGSNGRQPS